MLCDQAERWGEILQKRFRPLLERARQRGQYVSLTKRNTVARQGTPGVERVVDREYPAFVVFLYVRRLPTLDRKREPHERRCRRGTDLDLRGVREQGAEDRTELANDRFRFGGRPSAIMVIEEKGFQGFGRVGGATGPG